MIKGFVSDMDGVVADTESLTFEAMKSFFAQYGKKLDITGYRKFIGKKMEEDIALLKNEFGLPIDESTIVEELKRHFDPLYGNVKLNAGYGDLLDFLQKRNVKMSLVSASWRNKINTVLGATGIADRFVVALSAEETGGKENAYVCAADAMELSTAECFALEDSPTGLAAAKVAGLYCVAVPGKFYKPSDFKQADEIHRSIPAFVKNGKVLKELD